MGFRINTNVSAMYSHMQGTMNNRELDKSLSRLSTGLRINTAADDASGLVIADSLRAQANSLGQAIANGNDAIGLIQTADGALDEYSKILDTIKTKAVQAASDGQNSSSRLAIQKDINRLMEELNNIAKTTSFNGQKLLAGSFVNKEFQVGANANETVKASIASAETSQIGQTSRAQLSFKTSGANQLTIESALSGKTVTLESFTLAADNTYEHGLGSVADKINKLSGDTGITAKAVVSSTTAAIAAGTTGADFAINGITIGAVNVEANDNDGMLLNAINAKTTETGVVATKTEDGKITLTSSDGRAINVSGDVEDVMGSTGEELSTYGYIEVVQTGSTAFNIKGAEMGTAVGEDITITGTMTAVQDSTLAVGSVLASDTQLTAGSKLGVVTTASISMELISASQNWTLAVGTVLGSGAILSKDTELVSAITTRAAVTLSSDMHIAAGSKLLNGTKFDAGTVLAQDITVGGNMYKAGTTLTVDLTLDADTILAKDMVMHVDMQDPHASVAAGSTLVAGTTLGGDFTTTGTSTLGQEMTLLASSTLGSGTELAAGSIVGDTITLTGSHTIKDEALVKLGSVLGSDSKLAEDSTIGGKITLNADVAISKDMVIKAGSTLKSGTILKAGTVLEQDLTDAQAGGGAGSGLSKGTVLGADLTTTADIYVTKDFTMVKGSAASGSAVATIEAGSTLAANGGDQNSLAIANEEFTSLSSVDVTSLEGAMKAIDTVAAAISDLDAIRSGLGSVQNQLTSTINNISVTQVNVKAAESTLRDVDFAQESANFSKRNILSQAGSYAMSQANAVQQNVMRLLQ